MNRKHSSVEITKEKKYRTFEWVLNVWEILDKNYEIWYCFWIFIDDKYDIQGKFFSGGVFFSKFFLIYLFLYSY